MCDYQALLKDSKQCATSQSSEERRKLAKQPKRQLNRALLAREPNRPAAVLSGSGSIANALSAWAAESGEDQRGRHRSRGSASIDATSGGELQEDLRDDVECWSPFQD